MSSDVRLGEMILELKHNKECKGAAYKIMAEEVVGEGVEMRALTAEATLEIKNLQEITDAEEIVTALQKQGEVQVAIAAVGYGRTQQEHNTGGVGTAICGGRL